MVHVEGVQKIDQSTPLAFLNGLAPVIAKAQVHGALDLYPVEDSIDCFGCKLCILRVPSDVGFVHLDTGAWQIGDLLS